MTSNDQASKLTQLLALARDLGPASDTEKFLKRLTIAATELTDSEAGSILKFEEESNALRFAAAPWFPKEVIEKITIPIDESMAGWSFGNTEPLVIKDVSQDSRHFKAVDQLVKFTTTSLLAVPMIYLGNTIGVLEVVNKKDDSYYTEDDVTILEMLALYASMALWNSTLEERTQEARDEFSELDRLKGNFIAITSHELRTPLGLILGHATFLRETIGKEFREPMDTIIRNATRLKEIVENLSNMGNYEAGVASIRQSTVSIPGIIEDVASAFQDMANSKKISLKTDVKEELKVEADASKITVVLSNLVRNALTFTDKGGHVLLLAESVPGYVQVSVIDDGVGIPADDLSNVFERFFQVESHLTRRHPGMGLGLAVAKTIIELHGGRIWAESEHGKGSKFTFLLPFKPTQNPSSVPAFTSLE